MGLPELIQSVIKLWRQLGANFTASGDECSKPIFIGQFLAKQLFGNYEVGVNEQHMGEWLITAPGNANEAIVGKPS